MLNSVVLIGRLCKDPELRYTASGKAVTSMRLAVDRGTKDAEGNGEADFLNLVCWERLAESCANHLGKGRLIGVQGRIQVRKYTPDNGPEREIVEVVCSEVKFLDRAKE